MGRKKKGKKREKEEWTRETEQKKEKRKKREKKEKKKRYREGIARDREKKPVTGGTVKEKVERIVRAGVKR
jgi:hypothetical protein